MDIVTIFNYGLLGVIGLFALIGIIMGIKRGMIRSILRLITLGAAAYASYYLVTTFAPSLTGELVVSLKDTLIQTVGAESVIAELLNASSSLLTFAIQLVMALVSPLVFLVCFIVLSIVLLLVYGILTLFLPSKRRHPIRGGSRFVGLFISLVGGLLIAACIIVPIGGYVGFAANSIDTIQDVMNSVQSDSESAVAIDSTYVDAIKECNNNATLATIFSLADGKAQSLFNDMFTNKGAIDPAQEIANVGELLPAVMGLTSLDISGAFDATKPEPDLSALEDLVDFLGGEGKDNYRKILAEVLSCAATKWVNNETFMGISLKDSIPEDYKDCLDGVLNKLKDTTEETVVQDIQDLIDTIESLVKLYRTMSNMSSLGQGEVTIESLQDNMTDIFMSLTPGSCDIIKEAILGNEESESNILSSFISDEGTANTVTAILGDTFDALANMTDEEKAAEAAAITNIMAFATSDSGEVDAEDFVDSILDSSILSNVIQEQAAEEGSFAIPDDQKAGIESILDDKLADASEADAATIASLKALLGLGE